MYPSNALQYSTKISKMREVATHVITDTEFMVYRFKALEEKKIENFVFIETLALLAFNIGQC